MMENLFPVKLPPGIAANGTKYQNAGRWNDGNLIRFHEGAIMPVGGWQKQNLSGATISGTPLAALSWELADGTPYLALGTATGLYIIDGANVVYDISPAPADVPAVGSFDWDLTNFGAYLVATNTRLASMDNTLVNVYVWSGDTTVKAAPAWTTDVGPVAGYSVFATPERFLFVLRGQDPTTEPARTGIDTPYSERRIYWPSRETLSGFVSTDTNTGGNFDLQTDGRLICGAASRNESLLWTDTDLWTANYIGGDLIYSFRNVGRQCGIVSKRGYALTDKGAYWMGRGKFYIYDGFARSIPCEVTDAVFNNFNQARAHLVWTYTNPQFNEVTWHYPSAGALFADRYVSYNYVEDHWTFGVLTRYAGVAKRFTHDVVDTPFPAMFDSTGALYHHETGNARTAQAFVTSGPVEIGNGDRLVRLQGIVPDDLTAGDVALRVYAALAPDAQESLYGPYTLTPETPLRLTARQARIRLEEVNQVSWRIGTIRLAVKEVERRGATAGAAVDNVPASIEVVPSSVTLTSQQFFTFEAIVRNAEGQVLNVPIDRWNSDNTAQIPIDSTGTVQALATPATANITAEILSPHIVSNTAVCNVNGDDVPASIVIAPAAFNIIPTLTQQMTYVIRNAAGQIITNRAPDSWASSDATKATISGTGLVTGVASTGTTNMTASIAVPALTSNIAVATCTDPFVTHTFATGSATFVVTNAGTGAVRALIVGGGGSGGSVDGSGVAAGGGGAGGMIDNPSIPIAVGSYPIFVGQGGPKTFADHSIGIGSATGDPGQASTAFGLSATGGGAGLSHDATSSLQMNGGSGGGVWSAQAAMPSGTGPWTPPVFPGGTGVTGQGHNGGNGTDDGTGTGYYNYGGGGGGAGAAGSDYHTGNAGDGLQSDITGISTYYAGGGGAGYINSAAVGGIGGQGGGGNGGSGNPVNHPQGFDGVDGLGGGGGGGGATIGSQGGDGGDGVVIIRYSIASGIVATGGNKVVHS